MICALCSKHILKAGNQGTHQDPRTLDGNSHHHTFADLEQSARDGCDMCILFKQAVVEQYAHKLGCTQEEAANHHRDLDTPRRRQEYRRKFYITEDIVRKAKPEQYLPPMDYSVQRWYFLRSDDGDEPSCKPFVNLASSPASRSSARKSPTAACRGPSKTPSPPRALGLRYLWIDSLCIVQARFKARLEEQCAQMSRIYQGTLVTIAAAATPDCDAGFLRPRARPLLPDLAVEIAPGGFATTCTAPLPSMLEDPDASCWAVVPEKQLRMVGRLDPFGAVREGGFIELSGKVRTVLVGKSRHGGLPGVLAVYADAGLGRVEPDGHQITAAYIPDAYAKYPTSEPTDPIPSGSVRWPLSRLAAARVSICGSGWCTIADMWARSLMTRRT
ncbi:hypothetical protein B0T24DRAFT_670852 [Lasiosphaeria ovina]|uniref:Heterokaryon incompatibility domain-containing protein n=1 Tax=Lasiosphaeria ovina TaxID=92902 RepID=A0AAE0MYM7_9PEZI|nr:hypothetical protein B0T24DRAFT_670852 [Lasiosphaeria ovina]